MNAEGGIELYKPLSDDYICLPVPSLLTSIARDTAPMKSSIALANDE